MACMPADIEQIKREVDLVRLIEDSGVRLTRHGDTAKGLCMFHDDHHESLLVTISKQLWHCFPCGIGGTVFDWVMRRDRVSFAHAREILKSYLTGRAAAPPSVGLAKAMAKKLPCPLKMEAEDRRLLKDVVEYYHQTLLQCTPGLRYLSRRGIAGSGVIGWFKLGYADRTLGYRLPQKSRTRQDDIRGRLQKLGIIRESGHEHFNGSIVIPIVDENGEVAELYGRKVRDDLRVGTPKHLYLDKEKRPSPGRGVWNAKALEGQEEVILCEALIDALTFWCAGFHNVTSSYGADVFPEEHVEAFERHGVRRVLIAFDRDEAGDRGATMVAARLGAVGIGCFRVLFPHRMDANEYALKVQPAAKSLGLALQSAVWMGDGPPPARAMVLPSAGDPALAQGGSEAATETERQEVAMIENRDETVPGRAQDVCEPELQAVCIVNSEVGGCYDAPEPCYAAPESREAAPEPEEAPPPEDVPRSDEGPAPRLAPLPVQAVVAPPTEVTKVNGEEVVIDIGDRRYRVRGLAKNTSHDLMKVNAMAMRGEAYHVDNLDLYSHRLRQVFQKAVADELELDENVVKRDLGRVLLALETLRDAALKKTLEPKKAEKVEIPKERKLAALARLRTPGLISWIDESLSLCGLVGERTNKVVAYLACVSRLLAKPLAIMVQSSSAAGKSTLMEAVLALMPEESRVKYSAMTGQALFYMGETVDLRHKILAIAEEEGASRATYALKLLQSEGELSIVSTGKDPQTGELRSKVYEVVGPIMPIIPTTAIDLDEEWENRVIKLAVDEGREQTRRIHEMQRQMMTLEGIVAQRRRAKVMELHRDAQRLLRPLAVRIPYAMRLTFPSHATRTRRDHMKYLGLIQSIALLHQYQREEKELRTEDGQVEPYIDATPEDVELANELANEVLGRSLGELPAQTQVFLEGLHELVTKACEARQIARMDYRITRREILDHTHLCMTRVRAHLQRLVDYEYVLAHRGRNGETFVYELLYNGEARQRERFVLGLLDAERLRNEEGARTTGDLAYLGGHLAPTLPPPCLDLAPTLPGGTNGGNGASPKGSSGSEPISAENAKGPRSNGEHRRTRPRPEEGAR